MAAQHVLHTKLSDAGLRLWREGRRRRGLPLPSFGLGRRVEQLAPPAELARLRLSARLDRAELEAAAWSALAGLEAALGELAIAWTLPPSARRLLEEHRGAGGAPLTPAR